MDKLIPLLISKINYITQISKEKEKKHFIKKDIKVLNMNNHHMDKPHMMFHYIITHFGFLMLFILWIIQQCHKLFTST